ncbi:MAG TPA: NlpC/P60 family N-terminal domain-containing protein [Syntrophobacteraceae bacterium]|nr:NlpC/P60 family N-terminal domain-containing protein [Syntrophobacteraceae bacterium]
MKRRFDQLLLLLLAAWISGCAVLPEIIEDIRVLPQDNTVYLDPLTADSEAVTPERQKALYEGFMCHFFLPWNQAASLLNRERLILELARCRNNPGYGENSRKHTGPWFDELARNADLETYPNRNLKGITLDNSGLRLLPTHKPHFTSLRSDGTGYPFDNLQNSAIPANTPILIVHAARDGSWSLVDSHYGSGWLPARDVATVDPELASVWEDSRFVAIKRDDVPVYDMDGSFLFKTRLGAQFPLLDEEGENYRIMVARAGEQRTARISHAVIPRDAAVRQPMKLTQANIARTANELVNKPYGWGGLYQNRDCSAMLKDLFAPFGLWLPRHSSDQALEGGAFRDLSLFAPEFKEELILKHGVPFLTLIWVKGHIMLYIGSLNGRVMVFHNFWGIKTRDIWGREGRKVVGHAAITSLYPGAELTNVEAPGSGLLNRLEGMSLLVQPSIIK